MSTTKESQNVHPQRKRKLTPEQRERLLRERRRRAFMKRVYLSLAGIAVLIVVVVVLVTSFGKNIEKEPSREVVASNANAGRGASQEQLSHHLPEGEHGSASRKGSGAQGGASGKTLERPTATSVPTPTPAPTVPMAMDERLAANVPSYDPSAPFSYPSAYMAAVLGADTGPAVTPDYSGIDPNKLDRWPSVEAGFMPMLSHANTTENIIAVTVDDCFQGDNLKKIVACALQNNAKLTIFPIGENLEKPSVAEVVKAAWQQGMEIENHTYSHMGTYHYDDDAMADDIWKQSYLLNQVLGVNYKQHFYRPKGGDERFDQRSHAYINQLGFSAMALWTQSGSVDPMDNLLSNLGPGRIYLFHTTDNDLNKLLKFIPAAVKKGYRLVTLNEMFGLPANETADLSTAAVSKPALSAFQVQPMTLKATAYARAAAVVQQRLIDLGWMKGEATGVYGKTTHACMAVFQAAAGLTVDGEAGIESQRALFSNSAPMGSDDQIRALSASMSSSVQSAIQEMFYS